MILNLNQFLIKHFKFKTLHGEIAISGIENEWSKFWLVFYFFPLIFRCPKPFSMSIFSLWIFTKSSGRSDFFLNRSKFTSLNFLFMSQLVVYYFWCLISDVVVCFHWQVPFLFLICRLNISSVFLLKLMNNTNTISIIMFNGVLILTK